MRLQPESRVSRRDRRFFVGMAIAAVATVFFGFAPTYYLNLYRPRASKAAAAVDRTTSGGTTICTAAAAPLPPFGCPVRGSRYQSQIEEERSFSERTTPTNP